MPARTLACVLLLLALATGGAARAAENEVTNAEPNATVPVEEVTPAPVQDPQDQPVLPTEPTPEETLESQPPATELEPAQPDTTAAEPEPQSIAPAAGGNAAPLIHGRLALSLEDAIKMGLENNLDVQVERYAPLIAEMDADAAWGAYDPEAFAQFGYFDNKTPTSNALIGSDVNVNRGTDGFGGLRGVLPLTGTIYSAEFDSARLKTNSAIEDFSPKYTSDFNIAIAQPVLRGLIWNAPWTNIKSSRLLAESSEESFRGAVMDTVRAIEDAYWNLIAANRAEFVAEKSLETAKALLDQTRTQFEVGVVSKVEVTEAEAGLSQREVALIRARNDYRNQQDVLIDLVLGPGLRAASTLEIDPTDNPVDIIAYEIEPESAVARAIENRPELVEAQKEIKRQEVLLAFARNQRLPALDGVFSYGRAGLSGDPNPDRSPIFGPPPPGQGDYDKTFEDYDDTLSYSTYARFSIPIPNTTARKNVSRTEFELSRAETRLRRLEQDIILDVRQSARNLRAAQEGIVAAESARRAADEQLRAERIRLEYGESTPFDVLLREEQLVDRENELINAYRAYHLSVTALDRAQGTILRNRNIAISDVAPLR
jgi:outer membrane protein TolC